MKAEDIAPQKKVFTRKQTIKLMEKYFHEKTKTPEPIPPSLVDLNNIVEGVFRVKGIFTKTRKRTIIDARYAFFYHARENNSFVGLARMSGFNNSTIIHAVRKANDLIDSDKEYRRKIEEVGIALEQKPLPST